jgi:hypothetical protein
MLYPQLFVSSKLIKLILLHDTVEIILGHNSITDPNRGDNFNGNPLTFINGTVSVALAAVVDLADSDNVTWAVNSTELSLVAIDANTNSICFSSSIVDLSEG